MSGSAIVSAVETVRHPAMPELLWLRVETEDGLVGLGETLPRPRHLEEIVHERLAPLLVGHPVAPAAFFQRALEAVSYQRFSGAEVRAVSVVDMALWDLLGQRAGRPVHELLGGPIRTRVPTYNTCASRGRWDDHTRMLKDPGGLARELRDEGFAGMKVWPFDDLSVATSGQWIERRGLLTACRTLSAIREAVGDELEVAIEGHSCWGLAAAIQIALATEEFRPMWLEDMIQARDPQAWRELRAATSTPVCGSERLFTRWEVRPFLDAGALDVVNQDVGWTGGISETMAVASLAAAHDLSLTLHCCHGPVATSATAHVAAAVPNSHLMENVRSFQREIHPQVVERPLGFEHGAFLLGEEPGLGVRLREDFLAGAARRRHESADGPVGWASGDPWAGGVGDRV